MYELKDTFELTDDELITVTGDGGAFGISGLGLSGFATGPFITAFTNQNAASIAQQAAVQQSVANHNAYMTVLN
jgi:hypothetical protein